MKRACWVARARPCRRRYRVFRSRPRGLFLERLQLGMRIAASLLSALRQSVRLPAVLRICPAPVPGLILRAVPAMGFDVLSGSEGRCQPRVLNQAVDRVVPTLCALHDGQRGGGLFPAPPVDK
jgi:hypothetical protein